MLQVDEVPIASSIEEVFAEFEAGRMVIVVDDEDRENEGDLLVPASLATPEHINFMARYGCGLVCVPITEERARQLKLPYMTELNTSLKGTPFTVSVDAREGTTTGISAFDRAKTVEVMISPEAGPDDLLRPGHLFPLVARRGGVLVRAGHTEAAVDLASLAGLYPAGVICEVMKDDGRMARMPDLVTFARHHDLKICTIADLIAYRWRKEKLITREATTDLPTAYGEFTLIAYRSIAEDTVHLALVKGEVRGKENVLVRMHLQAIVEDVFRPLGSGKMSVLSESLSVLSREPHGVLVYLNSDDGGNILLPEDCSKHLSQGGSSAPPQCLQEPSELRHYGVGAQILADLGLHKIRLLSNTRHRIVGLEGFGLEIVEQVPLLRTASP
jgi:3,4-dihydroxy 2-butanone 4-phosphate synthase/GTP cyclohydrolase II